MSDTEVIVRPRCGRLNSVRAWRREVGRIYRSMRTGQIPPTEGTKLAFVADVGARLARVEEELRQTEALIAARAALPTQVRPQISREDLYGAPIIGEEQQEQAS